MSGTSIIAKISLSLSIDLISLHINILFSKRRIKTEFIGNFILNPK